MAEQTHLQPSEVHEVLGRHVLTDGMNNKKCVIRNKKVWLKRL